MENSEPTYSSINSLNTKKDDDLLDKLPDDTDTLTDDDEHNPLCKKNIKADIYRLCKTKAAHDAVLGRNYSSLVKKTLTAVETPHLDTKRLITKLDDVARTVDLVFSTILTEQFKDPVLVTFRSWLRKGILHEAKSAKIAKIQQCKGVHRYCQEFDGLLIE